jgi:predicted RNA-binding Zn ribbon-like protein
MSTITTRTDQEASVPAPAAALVDLLNSRAYAIHADKLDNPELVTDLLRPFGQEDGEPSPRRLDLVRALRADLMDLVAAGDPADAAQDWAAFTGRTSSITFQQDFSTPGHVRLSQVSGDPVVGGITLDVAALVTAGTWSRLRICANDVCRRVFYDTTRSRTRRWHSYEICGNRNNVAAYRARTAKSSATPDAQH